VRTADRSTLVFIFRLCLACGSLVAAVSLGLESAKSRNRRLETRENLLSAAGLLQSLPRDYDAEAVHRLFENRVHAVVPPGGDTPPVYRVQKDGETDAWVLPLHGRGLWSDIFGFLALEKDLDTVRGAAFYGHRETPGLGAQISSRRFQEQFRGKKIRDADGVLRGIEVERGAGGNASSNDPQKVDGISGATWTGRAVTRIIADTLARYEPFFDRRKAGPRNPAGDAP
jgi:Na+-transporting NADH:ubiquinone oxidoreductase subunit C